MNANLAFGKGNLEFTLPDILDIQIIQSLYEPGAPDQEGLVWEALNHPLGSESLTERIADPRLRRVAIVFNDITRASPYVVMLPPLLEILEKKGLDIRFYNATGTHRANSREELLRILGKDVVGNYPVIQNDCNDQGSHGYIGTTGGGNEVRILKDFLACDLKILTGFIEPHFFAGFSGGGKAVMPGLAELSTIHRNHNTAHLDDSNASWGITKGNPLWEEIRDAALMVENTFLFNVAMNRDKEVTRAFAGDLLRAHEEGCAYVKHQAMVKVPHLFDIVITGNSGYPLDLNMYQAVKGMSAAARIVKEGGDIIMAADCWDGVPEHGNYGRLLREARDPRDCMERIRNTPVMEQDSWQAYIQAQICLKAQVHFYTRNLGPEIIRSSFMVPVASIEKTLEAIIANKGREKKLRVCVLSEGPQTIPYLG